MGRYLTRREKLRLAHLEKQKEINKEVEEIKNINIDVFIISINDKMLERCLSYIKKQDCLFNIKIIKNVQPMSEAFNRMIQEADKDYFVQVDEDMILRHDAIKTLYNAIKATKNNDICVCYNLHDKKLNIPIQGIKIYKTKPMKQFSFKNMMNCEMDLIKQWEENGFNLVLNKNVIGDHDPYIDTKSIYHRFKTSTEKEIFGFGVIRNTLRNKLKPLSEEDKYIVLGILSGIFSDKRLYKNERSIFDYNDINFNLLKEYFENDKDIMRINKDPEISVILPVYNDEKDKLKSSIDSIINQSFPDFELLIVCNGSQSALYNFCLEYQNKDKRVKVLRLTKPNLVDALNHGIDNARGRFIARQDGDDISHKDRFMNQYYFMMKNNHIGLCGTNGITIDSEGKEKRNFQNFENINDIKKYLLVNNCFTHGSMMVKTELLKENKYSNEYKHAEDYDLWSRLIFNKNVTASNIQLPLYYYREGNGVSTQNKKEQNEKAQLIRNRNINFLNNCEEVVEVKMENPLIETIEVKKEIIPDETIIKKNIEFENRTYNEKDILDNVEIINKIKNIRKKCDCLGIRYNIDGLDNNKKELPRYWEYSCAVKFLNENNNNGKKILDAGSGFSLFPLILEDFGYNVTSIDASFKNERNILYSTFGSGVKVDVGNFISLPYKDNSFDNVTCISCLEHIKDKNDLNSMMDEFHRIIKKDGYLVLSVDFHKDYYDYGKAHWKWSESARYYNWDQIKKDFGSDKFEFVSDKFVDNTDWNNPPLYDNYTFGFFVLKVVKK